MSTLEQEQLDACRSPTSMTSKCLISPAEQEERWHHHQHRNHNCSHCGCPSTKKVNNNKGDTDIKRTDDNYTITSRWTSTSAESTGRHTYVIDSTSTGQLTDGHSTNKPSQQTSNAITAKETPGGWHSRRKLNRATANSSTARSTSTTGAKTGTTKEQTEDHQAYTQNKTRWGDHSLLMWGCNRTTNRTNPSRTHREQHRWIWQTEHTWRNEAGDSLHEATAGLHISWHQHTDPRATQEHNPVPLGPARQRQQGSITDCRKRIHRNSDGLGWHLRVNTHFCVLRTLLTLACTNGWIGLTGDVSTAFLHAAAATADLYMYPPKEFYNPQNNIVWKLLKAIYRLRSSPKARQKHLSEVQEKRARGQEREDVKMWGWEDVKVWRWENVKIWRLKDVKMWRRCEGVKMRRCEDLKIKRCENVKMRRCKMRRCEDMKMRRLKDVKMRRWEDVKMRRCKMRKYEDVKWEDVKMFEDVYTRPPLLEEPFAQTLSGKMILIYNDSLFPMNEGIVNVCWYTVPHRGTNLGPLLRIFLKSTPFLMRLSGPQVGMRSSGEASQGDAAWRECPKDPAGGEPNKRPSLISPWMDGH